MTLIKSEPQADTSLTFQGGRTDAEGLSRGLDGKVVNSSDSRPALSSKKVNVEISKKEPNKNPKKQTFEEFLLSPGSVGSSTLDVLGKISSHSPKEKLPIKKEPEVTKGLFHEITETPIKRQTDYIDSVNGSNKKKKKNTADKFKKVTADTDISSLDSGKQQLETLGAYTPINKLLYESNNDFREGSDQALFQDLEHESERKFCREASKWPLAEWIDQGQVLLKAHTNLVGQLVQQRIELSHKFQAITTVINERADALNKQGEILDEKMTKIENLGKEILNII